MRSVLEDLRIRDARILQFAWNTWRSRRVCTCVHHAAIRHHRGFHCYACNGAGVCFFNGNGSAQEPDASSLAVCWKDILHVLGLRIVVLGSGGCQARGLSVAWLAQASPRVDVAKVPIRLVKSFEFLEDHIALDVPMSLVIYDNILQATEELQQQAAAALATMTLSLRRGPRLAWQAQATPRVDVAEVSIASSGFWGQALKR